MTQITSWTKSTIGECFDTQLGKMLNNSKQIGTDSIPYLRNINVQWGSLDLTDVKSMDIAEDEREKFTAMPGDLLVCEGGAVGRCAIWHGPQSIGIQNALHRIRSTGKVELAYLRYYLEYLSFNGTIATHASGVTIKHLTQEKLRKLPIAYPDIANQQRIVATLQEHLSRLDKALAEVNHVSNLLKVQRSSLVHNQIARLKAENTPMKALSEVFDMQTGPAFQSKDFTDASQGIRLLRGENIEPGALRWINTKSWRHDKLDGFEKYFVQENDLILAMDRPLVSAGLKLAVVKKDDLPCLLVQRVARMRANGKALAEYVYPFLLSLDFESHLAIDSTGTQIPHISMNGIGSFEIPVPSHERQLELALEMTEAAQAFEIASQTTERARLQISTLRRSLLFSAFAGEL